jgi:hypothetical protein
MQLWVELWVGVFSGFRSNLLKNMVGAWGLEPQTCAVSMQQAKNIKEAAQSPRFWLKISKLWIGCGSGFFGATSRSG